MRINEDATILIPTNLTLSESAMTPADLPKSITPIIRAMTANKVTRNKTYYPIESLIGDRKKTGYISFSAAYFNNGVPVIRDHKLTSMLGEASPIFGRIIGSDVLSSNTGASYLRLVPNITDPYAIERVLDKRFLTVSIGIESNSVVCSICGLDLAKEGYCEHIQGQLYPDPDNPRRTKECYWIIGPIEGLELSFVPAPSDDEALVLDPNPDPQLLQSILGAKAEAYLAMSSGRTPIPEYFNKLDQREILILNESLSNNDDSYDYDLYAQAEEITTEGVLSTSSLPIADRDHEWDAGGARSRIKSWSGSKDKPNAKYARAFLYVISDKKDTFGGYKFPVADIVNGKLTLIPKAVFAAAGRLSSAKIPDSDKAKLRSAISRLYSRLRSHFKDSTLTPPWENKKESSNEEPQKESRMQKITFPMGNAEEILESLQSLASYKGDDRDDQRLQIISEGLKLKLDESDSKDNFLKSVAKSAAVEDTQCEQLVVEALINKAKSETNNDVSDSEIAEESSSESNEDQNISSETLSEEANSNETQEQIEESNEEPDELTTALSNLHYERARMVAVLNKMCDTAQSRNKSIEDLINVFEKRSTESLKDSIEDLLVEASDLRLKVSVEAGLAPLNPKQESSEVNSEKIETNEDSSNSEQTSSESSTNPATQVEQVENPTISDTESSVVAEVGNTIKDIREEMVNATTETLEEIISHYGITAEELQKRIGLLK